ncbi:ABC transporter permease subunit [Phycicoccus sp. MAQZ13P-2]|uniref:ABC transporter permease n=1 Tax=Phycicoccus mangrovi TaxID=2840470 RepID=UPI001C006A4A|nr:ABC transporter permease subunit [Phycicoccus mangrovi]MBT9254072.1 ABC transporter permease subunit [Phycicoccus mangrovi]MBT9272452.1 ABC transporter permease subunit [Phycicoccus mangrovi]
MTTTLEPARPAPPKEAQPVAERATSRRTGPKLLGVLALWLLAWATLRGRQTLELANADTTGLHDWFNDVRDRVQLLGQDNWFFHGVLGTIASGLDTFVGVLQEHLSSVTPGDWLGWFGVLLLAAWVTYALAGLRSTVLVTVVLLFLGLAGLWTDGVDTLIVTIVAVVICMVVGLPLGIAMSRSRRTSAVVTPVLDAMQTMPSFAYLTPIALFFGIGPACAIVLTLVYALPPLVRITEHGLNSVAENTVEAGRSLGVTKGQLLRQVQLPMAKRTIVVGINQCTMAALSMATIAALVNGPGLGKPVIAALQTLNVGAAAVAGLGIVLIAIMLDRTTTAASERSSPAGQRVTAVSSPGFFRGRTVVMERLPRWATEEGGRGTDRRFLTASGRRLVLAVLLLPVLVGAYYSTRYLQLSQFPDLSGVPVLGELTAGPLGGHINDLTNAVVDAISGVTNGFKDLVTAVMLNPLQSLMSDLPWWVMALVLLAVAYLLGGWRPTVVTLVCEAVVLGTGLWYDAMVTLTMTLVATFIVMLVAVVLGVAMGRGRRADTVIRPFLDGLQTIPAFVYLVPALALFAATRFTAIMAAVAYAVPIATKLVADGVRGVSPATVEAARSTGITRWQMISKVQLPMAREALVLATNQGLLYVLSMVVIGGMVGGGSLGYLIVQGFVQGQLFGKGLAAGIAITALGIMLDRIARHAAARFGR